MGRFHEWKGRKNDIIGTDGYPADTDPPFRDNTGFPLFPSEAEDDTGVSAVVAGEGTASATVTLTGPADDAGWCRIDYSVESDSGVAGVVAGEGTAAATITFSGAAVYDGWVQIDYDIDNDGVPVVGSLFYNFEEGDTAAEICTAIAALDVPAGMVLTDDEAGELTVEPATPGTTDGLTVTFGRGVYTTDPQPIEGYLLVNYAAAASATSLATALAALVPISGVALSSLDNVLTIVPDDPGTVEKVDVRFGLGNPT